MWYLKCFNSAFEQNWTSSTLGYFCKVWVKLAWKIKRILVSSNYFIIASLWTRPPILFIHVQCFVEFGREQNCWNVYIHKPDDKWSRRDLLTTLLTSSFPSNKQVYAWANPWFPRHISLKVVIISSWKWVWSFICTNASEIGQVVLQKF